MTRVLALAPITTPELAPPETVSVAARTGYAQVGLRLLPSSPGGFAWPLATDAALLRGTLARLRDTGVHVLDIDIIRQGPDCDPAQYDRFFETGATLGARAVLLAADDPDPGRRRDVFVALCQRAARFGLTIDLEFMPWTAVPDLAAAMAELRATDQPNAGVVIDTLHVARSDTPIAALRAVEPRWLHYMQICDAPAERPATTEALIHAARSERLFPGEGALDLAGMLTALPADIPISIEVPRETLARTVPAEERARRAREATEALLARLP
ncbi:MAG: sugar phosphate isomerase/epimerase [Rhodospirillales bacterium]|nr:sugar phosphate isomerase/epimerase [Rhodospirillales bacterium]